MLPPDVAAPTSFYGAPVDASGAETEAILEEILPVPAEEPQVIIQMIYFHFEMQQISKIM